MGYQGTATRVQFEIADARFLHIEPRPRADSPEDLEQTLLELVRTALESDAHDGPADCDCVIGERVEVCSRDQIKEVSDGTYTAWYQVRLVKYRTVGELMPAADELPAAAR